ncbi:MAG: hypothetical protein E7501_02085 [Ruminococcus sp.]|nr:hypothetical protein [Ruminococcus sp.]MBQ8906803.1 hypothetical protein [Ruminococcus sp.]
MKRLKELYAQLSQIGGQRIILLLGGAGLCLILLSTVLPERDEKVKEYPAEQTLSQTDADYGAQLEAQLGVILAKLSGVGRAEVMITLEDTGTQIYAEEIAEELGEQRHRTENSYVLLGGGSDQSALLESVKQPQVSGVVILCEGGDSSIVREQVIRAASVACSVPTTQIFVGTLTD